MTTRLNRGALAATALIFTLGAQSAAHADATVTATIGAYQYTLVDLDPNDGIAPSITWGTAQVTQSLTGSLSSGIGEGGAPNTVASKALSQTIAAPAGSTPSLTYAGYGVSSGPDGNGVVASVSPGGQWTLSEILTQSFVLSANTAVTFTALAQTSLGVTVPDGSVVTDAYGRVSNGYFDWAPLQASASAVLFVGDTPQSWNAYVQCKNGCVAADNLLSSIRTYATGTLPDEKLLQVTFTNATGNVVSSQIGTGAYTQGYATAPIALVPEASTFAQMLLGLGGLGLVLGKGRRRGRHDSGAMKG